MLKELKKSSGSSEDGSGSSYDFSIFSRNEMVTFLKLRNRPYPGGKNCVALCDHRF